MRVRVLLTELTLVSLIFRGTATFIAGREVVTQSSVLTRVGGAFVHV